MIDSYDLVAGLVLIVAGAAVAARYSQQAGAAVFLLGAITLLLTVEPSFRRLSR